jgi:thiamine biosynthesis lipoprotein
MILPVLLAGCVRAAAFTGDLPDALTQANYPGTAGKYTRSFATSFDTVITLVAYTASEAEFIRYADAAEALFLELHQLFDIYHEYPGLTNLMSVNRHAGQGPLKVDPRILDLIEFYQQHDPLAPGQVNAALGPVLAIWHDHRLAAANGDATVPDLTELQAAARHTDPSVIRINRADSTLELTDPQASLDVGAVAKGYATELVARRLLTMGLKSGIISAGGSNIRLIGRPADPTRSSFAVGIQNPFLAEAPPDAQSLADISADIIETDDTSIATSGDYQRYYSVDGIQYHHLIDPTTLMPAHYQRAVTIMTPDSALADYLSTAVFLLPYATGRQLVESLPDCEALWIFQDGSLAATDGMEAVLRDKARGNARVLAEAVRP